MLKLITTKMIGVSNNSRLTNSMANTIEQKLDKREQAEFLQWLQLVKQERYLAISNVKKY